MSANRRIGRTINFLLRKGYSYHDAADAAQEAEIVAWERGEELPDPYVYGIARHKGANAFRAQQRQERIARAWMDVHMPVQRAREDGVRVLIPMHDVTDHVIPMYTNKYRDDVLHGDAYLADERRKRREREARKRAKEVA